MERAEPIALHEDRVADLRARWTPEATAAAVAFLESRPVAFDLPTIEQGGVTFLDLRGLRIEQTQIDKAYLRNVNLRWAVFRDVGFKNARFVGCNLSQVNFSDCYLRRAQFEKCDLVNSRFESCDFSQAVIAESRVDFASFRNCEIGLQTIKFRADVSPRAMVRVCRGLKLNAMSMGNFADAGELTYLEKTYERLGYFRERAWGRWLGSALQDWLWGYGERPWRLAFVMAFNIALFGSLFHFLDPLPDKTWWEHVYFSGITYLTVGYGDLAPHAPLARLISVVCAATGIATFGLLIASVTKKIMYR
jgi:Ion channel/Pentapeptide repeats (9 copies)